MKQKLLIVFYLCCFGTALQAQEDILTERSVKHYVGELYGGGIIFSIDSTEQHGLIASLDDMCKFAGRYNIAWSNIQDVATEAASTSNGLTNSKTIVAQSGHTFSAAQLCLDYSINGFDDWYLPTTKELKLLWNVSSLINKILDNDNNEATHGLANDFYWSSEEISNDSVLVWAFGNVGEDSGIDYKGYSLPFTKYSNRLRARAVRAF